MGTNSPLPDNGMNLVTFSNPCLKYPARTITTTTKYAQRAQIKGTAANLMWSGDRQSLWSVFVLRSSGQILW